MLLADGRGWVTQSSYNASGEVEVFMDAVTKANVESISNLALTESISMATVESKLGFVINLSDSDIFAEDESHNKPVS
jgi:hypothetical protein